jgi:glycosyltransferase involved in cell wall biosynthesis
VNILFLDQFSELGGAQQVLLDTLDAVREQGWRAHVLIPEDGPLWDEVGSRGIAASPISSGPYRAGRKSATDLLRFPLGLWQQVRTINHLTKRGAFDLIYVNGPRLLPAAWLTQRGRARVLFHAHSHVRQQSAARLAGRSVQRAAATVVGCSQSVLEPLRRYTDQLHLIPNGVRDMGFHPRDFHRGRGWRIGLIGRIAPEKGQAEFVRAIALLRHELPESEFLICGAPLFGVSDGYAAAVRSMARELPVKFLGWHADVGPILRTLDLLVVPSTEEGMARVTVEAFSAGVPVIAFPTGGIPEVVKNGETGFLTRAASPDALAERIRDVVGTEPHELNRIAFHARRVWQRSYTLAAYKNRITRLLESLVAAASPEREREALPQPQ